MNNTPEDIKKLEKEIKRIEIKHHEKDVDNDASSEMASSRKGLRIVIEFVSGVFSGGAIGYFLDILFDTKPFLLIFFLLFGVVAGFLNVYRFVKSSDEEV